MSQSSFPRALQRAGVRTVDDTSAPFAWPLSALLLLTVSGAFWLAVVEAAIHIL